MLAVVTIVWLRVLLNHLFCHSHQLGLELVSYFHLSPFFVVSQGVPMRGVPYLPNKKHHSTF